jgi:hypothetical protein
VGEQAIAVLLADGRLALSESVEEDLWEETAEEAADSAQLPDLSAPEPDLGPPMLPVSCVDIGRYTAYNMHYAR